jgi:hypothetical protein
MRCKHERGRGSRGIKKSRSREVEELRVEESRVRRQPQRVWPCSRWTPAGAGMVFPDSFGGFHPIGADYSRYTVRGKPRHLRPLNSSTPRLPNCSHIFLLAGLTADENPGLKVRMHESGSPSVDGPPTASPPRYYLALSALAGRKWANSRTQADSLGKRSRPQGLQALKGRPNEAQADGLCKRSRPQGLQAPQGRPNEAQADGLGKRSRRQGLQAPKGRPNPSFSPGA